MTRSLLSALSLLVLLAPLGCGTLITKIDSESKSECDGKKISPIYSGTRLSLGCARTSEVAFIWVIDVPLSFTADTGVLPISLLQVGYGWARDRFFPVEEEPVLQPEATIAPGS
jgi:uncharacterized protein YceK